MTDLDKTYVNTHLRRRLGLDAMTKIPTHLVFSEKTDGQKFQLSYFHRYDQMLQRQYC